MFTFHLTSEAHLKDFCGQLLKAFPGQKIFLFEGEMGAGKTTIIKALCRSLGVTGSMSSPTYSIVNEYEGRDGKIYHFDLYRLKSTEECMDIGFEEYVHSGRYCFIEWPEIGMPLLPDQFVEVNIKTKEESRYITAKLSHGV